MASFIAEGETTVAAGAIERWYCLAVGSFQPRFFDVERIGGPVMPVIGVIADRNDDFVGWNLADGGRKAARPPLLRRDRSGRAVGRMFVVGHEEQLVGDPGEARHVPFAGDRDRDRDQPSMRREPRPRFMKQF